LYSDLTAKVLLVCFECNVYGSLLLFEVGGWLSAWQGQNANVYVEDLLYNVRDERDREREREENHDNSHLQRIPALVQEI
jgi:hypothetical protein